MSRPSADNAPEIDSNPPTDSLNDARGGREEGRERARPSARRGAGASSASDSTTESRSGGTSVPCRFGTEESCGYDGVMGQTQDLPGGC